MTPDLVQRLQSALAHHQRRESGAAEQLYRDILAVEPHCPDALHLLGVLLCDSGRFAESAALISRAVILRPELPALRVSLARTLLGAGRAEEALASLDEALARQPADADAWLLRGNAAQRAGAAALAIDSYREAIRLRPHFPEAFNNLGVALRGQRDLPAALDALSQALRLRPRYASALNNLGLVLLDGQQPDVAADCFERALAVQSDHAEALHNLGTALMQSRRFEEASRAFALLVGLAPGFPHARGGLLAAKLNVCDWDGYERLAADLSAAVARGESAAVPLSYLCITDSAPLQRRCASLYTSAHFPAAPPPYPHAAPRRRDRIHVAYLSGDFGEHPVTYLLAGVLARHDPSRFEITGLSWGRGHEGPARRGIVTGLQRFIDITTSSDAEVVRLMRQLDVDIAVDLSGHTQGQRSAIFAQRAAAVQVNYLGLPATMGADYMDYLIADRYLVPDSQRPHYAEQVVWLPGCFQPNDDRRALRPCSRGRSAHGLPARGIVFCCFNAGSKLNPGVFDAWCRLLRQAPASTLWLFAADPGAQRNLRREAAQRGLDPQRLVFANPLGYEDHLARYSHADLFLDTLPFNGGATASDALSMGVPVLTLSGSGFASRMAGSLLSHLGLAELVARSWDDYVAIGAALAADPQRLAGMREYLLRARTQHDFFNTDRYRVGLEAAYEAMWERRLRGLPPAALEF